MKKQFFICALLSFVGVIILNFIDTIINNTRVTGELTYYFVPFLCIFVGVLIESRLLLRIIKGDFTINFLIIPSLLLFIFAFIPIGYIALEMKIVFGAFLNIPIFKILISDFIRPVIFVFTGIILVRSFSKEYGSLFNSATSRDRNN